MPAMTLPSLKKKEEELSPSSPATPTAIAYIRPYRTRTSSLPKVPRSSSMSTVESLDEEQQPTKVRTSAIGSMRKKTVNRLSVEGLVGRKSAGYTHSTGSPSFGHFLKDQTQDTEEVKEHQQLKLLLALEKSMQQGAYVTKKLYIPKSLWQQHNVKLSFVDIKISACETLANDIHRLENWAYLDDLLSSLRLLEHVETSVESLKTNLSKKFKRESTNGGNQTSSAGHTNGTTKVETAKKSSQSFMSWGTKLTKSVERMNAFSLTKGEDHYKQYIEALERLLKKIHTLEKWLNYYHEEKKRTNDPRCEMMLVKLSKVCDVINTIIGGFVVRDMTVLLAKWLKRGGSWVSE